jgi:putative SOS response-associated peptidase YedK
MCSNYRRAKSYAQMRDEFSHIRLPVRFPDGTAAPNLAPQDEILPTDQAVVFRVLDNGVELVRMRWGLVPFFHKKPLREWKAATFNAKAETVKTLASFREPFRRRRCLIAADGWVEWKGEGKPKPKFYIAPRGGEPICFAGLWCRTRSDADGEVESFTMVTQPPGALSDVHDRAPVVLAMADWARWLDVDADVDDLLGVEPVDRFEVRPFTPLASEDAGL